MVSCCGGHAKLYGVGLLVEAGGRDSLPWNLCYTSKASGSFPKIRGTFLRVPIIRTIVFWGLYWVSPILGNYHVNFHKA